MSVNYSTVAQVGYHKSKQPASIPELEEMAMLDLWDDSKDFEYHLIMAEKYQKEGKECARRGDLEGAFIKLTRAVTLMAKELPMHRDYNVKLNSSQRTNLFLNEQVCRSYLKNLTPALIDRFACHPDGVEHDHARTQRIADDDTTLAQTQREKFQAEGRTSQSLREKWDKKERPQAPYDMGRKTRTNTGAAVSVSALEAQPAAATNAPDYTFSTSAAEAVKRKWQEQQPVEEYDTHIDAATKLSRKPNGYGSQSAITRSYSLPREGDNRHRDFPSRATSHLREPPSRFYRDDYGPESLTPNYTQTIHLPPQTSQFNTPRWASSSHNPGDVPKRPMDPEFMTRLAKLRQQTQGTSSSINSASQVGQKYLLGSPNASFVSSGFSSQSVSTVSMPPAVEFPPTPVFTDQMNYWNLIERGGLRSL